MDSTETPPKIRKKLLKPRSQKYYSRKAKIEQALRNLDTEKFESTNFPSIPSSAITFPPSIFSVSKENATLREDHEILCIPTENPTWVSSATKIEKFHLPTYITKMNAEESKKLSRVLNMNTWRQLPPSVQLLLSQFLPNFTNFTNSPEEEIENTLSLLFSGKNFFFGNPIEQFLAHLAEKRYQPQRRTVIQNQKLIGQFTHIQFLKERNQNFIRKVIELKNNLELDEPHNYLLLPTTSKQYSSAHLCSDYMNNSDTDADSGGEDSLSIRSQKDLKEKLSAAVSRKEEPGSAPDKNISGNVLGKRQRSTGRSTSQTNRQLRNVIFNGDSDKVVPPGPVWIFFTSIRDLFILNNFEMSISQIEEEFEKDAVKSSCVVPSFSLHDFLLLGLNFLKSPPLVSLSTDDKKKKSSRNSRKSSNASNSTTPSITSPSSNQPDNYNQATKDRKQAAAEYQAGGPFVASDPENSELWRWVGAVDEDVIREELDTLELLFYFAVTRNQVSDCKTMVNLVTVKQQKCASTIRPSTEEETAQFRSQEQERYLAPERPFCYQFRDFEAIVAPMKRGLGNQSQKPRDHFLLQKERPPHISLLCLVRDAAARLPGGIGTRPDVAILLCDSQYIVQDVSESKLNTVVSGALDRLHAQEDPCVKFDSDQKLWIYLHRRRKPENFPVYKPQKKKGRR